MNERQKLLNKIRALLSKTVENGCTEAEALAALDMASRMMDAYEVTAEDIELKGESAEIRQNKWNDPQGIRKGLAVRIAAFCDCKVWRDKKGKITFCGMQSDVDFAMWLLDTLSNFVKTELIKFLPGAYADEIQKRRMINGFVLGCCMRINERLRLLKEGSEFKAKDNSRALVVAKNAVIIRKMQEVGIELRKARGQKTFYERDSFSAGKAAGDRATFGRPVGQNEVRRIGNG